MLKSPRTFWLAAAKKALMLQRNPNKYAVTAIASMTAPWGVTESGMCSKAQRVISNEAGGTVYQALHGDTATETARNFEGTPYEVFDNGLPGDLYFYTNRKKHGPDGHVIRRVYGNFGVEVSSRYAKTSRDCRGIQPLAFFGKPDMIVREP